MLLHCTVLHYLHIFLTCLHFFSSLLLVVNDFVLPVGDTECNELEAPQIWEFEVASVYLNVHRDLFAEGSSVRCN